MARRLLLILSADPSLTGRPAEAVRLAAGLAACGQLQVRVYLHGPAVKALAPQASDAVDMDLLIQCWPLVASLEAPVLVEAGALQRYGVVETSVPRLEISRSALASWVGLCDTTIHFDAAVAAPGFPWEELTPRDPNLSPPLAAINKPLLLFPAEPVPGTPVVFDLSGPPLDYPRLLRELFRAGRIATL